jgi:multiple sugar transport system ATP-binding protein
MNFIEASLESASLDMARVRMGQQSFDARVDARGIAGKAPVTLGIRPEHAQMGGETGQPNTLSATVAFVEQLGEASYVYGRLGDGNLFTVRQSGDTAVRIGEEITIRCLPGNLHLFDAAGRAYRRLLG